VFAFGLRDVVVELARQRRPQVMDDAERRVAVLDVVDQDRAPRGCRRALSMPDSLRRILFQML
jgi:hypothetical protein